MADGDEFAPETWKRGVGCGESAFPRKAARLSNLAQRLADPTTDRRILTIPWYGGVDKEVEIATGICLWHRRGRNPLPIRWVLVRCPEESFKPQAIFCADPRVSAHQILAWFIARWSIELASAEIRARLGFETQRQWSDKAIERTTPCLFGLCSVVVLMATVYDCKRGCGHVSAAFT